MKITPIPTGTKDILPAEAQELRFLEESIRRVFASFGYSEVITPTLELEAGVEIAGEQRFKESFRLFDERGQVLVLRPDMTMPIARLVATKMAARKLPIRLCYFANSFRPTKPQRGRRPEFYQAGLEFIGADSPAVDAEVLSVICQAMGACRLKDFSIVLGEASFFKALLAEIGVNGKERGAIFAALSGRDIVELGAVVEALDVSAADRQAILDAVSLRGGSEALAVAKDLVRGEEMDEALKRLARTYYLVGRYGFAGRILFDLGLLRNFEYYTGIVFELVSGGLGFPLGGGGRYNGLLAKFGRPAPAVGFAVGLDRLHIAATSEGAMELPEMAGAALAGGLDQQLDLAMELRKKGVTVMAVAEDVSEAEAAQLAADAGLPYIVVPADERFRLVEVASGVSVVLQREELAGRLA